MYVQLNNVIVASVLLFSVTIVIPCHENIIIDHELIDGIIIILYIKRWSCQYQLYNQYKLTLIVRLLS
jgi:hypothetical protein